MKTLKNLVLFFTLFATMSMFLACEEVPDPPAPPTVFDLSNDVGAVHNKCMEYVRNFLKTELANVDTATMSLDKLRSMTKDGCVKFIGEDAFFEVGRAEALDVFEAVWADYARATDAAGTALSPVETYLENSTVLTPDQHSYALDALLVINNSTVPAGCEMGLDSLFDLVIARLGEENAIPVLMGCGVGKASFEYWTDHLDEWSTLGDLIGGNGRPIPGTTRGGIVKADVAGAVGGAGASVVTGCAELTFGACAAAGAAAGGIATSLSAGVEALWDHFF